jgi:hypothetical protein
MQLTAQGSITVKRLRNGDTLSIALNVSGALIQYLNEQTDTATPDWTVAANQPTITPKITSARSQTVLILSSSWSYNGIALEIGSDGYNTNAAFSRYFYVNSETGALTIKQNLASTDNPASDTLEFSATVRVGGVETKTSKSIDITIQPVGVSAYSGYVETTTTVIGEDVENAMLSTRLFSDANEVSTYGVKWYSGDVALSDNDNKKTLTVSRDMVNGSQIFIAEFYTDTSLKTAICRAGVTIVDNADDYSVEFSCSPTEKSVDENTPVTVTAKLMKMASGVKSEVDTKDSQWKMSVYETTNWTVIEIDGKEHTVDAKSITVTTNDTDYIDDDGVSRTRDVDVTATVTI